MRHGNLCWLLSGGHGGSEAAHRLQGPILRSIQRYGRISRRTNKKSSPEMQAEHPEDRAKDPRHLYLSIDEASTHVGGPAISGQRHGCFMSQWIGNDAVTCTASTAWESARDRWNPRQCCQCHLLVDFLKYSHVLQDTSRLCS